MQPGDTVGHYRILAPLGRGGMGEVYAAADTKLHRNVALKVLPAMMATEPEWRRRFEREAMTIAALNHPGIVTIHSVEIDGPTPFLTMELVEGRALREAIPGNGLPLDVLLTTAIAVIDAVAAAHHRGVVHRDLKPANVMLCPDGRVKVLDFGLAKVHDAEAAASGEASTRLPTDALTGEGRIVGTVAYMSPEQAEGKPVDQRSDIFSLGILLYEMATGQRPFTGDTGISILSSIIKDTPPAITDARPDLPPPLARIVRRCLIKDPLRRYQAARDLQTDLEDLKQDVDSGVLSAPAGARIAPPASAWRVPRKAAYFIAGAFVLLAAGAAWFAAARYLGAPAPFTATQFQRLTDNGMAALVAISPDGRYVVYVQRPHGEAELWIRQTAVGSTIQILPSTSGRFAGLAFSPDGNFVYYTLYPAAATVAALFKIPALGGAPVRVLENVDSAASFSPDGSQISFIRGQPTEGKQLLMIARADGGSPRALVVNEAPWLFAHQSAPWSPDGRTIIATTRDADIGAKSRLVSVDVASGRVTPLGRDWDDVDDAAWMPDGRSVVTTAAEATPYAHWQIWQVSWPAGERRALTSGLNEYERVSVAGDGRTIATIEGEFDANLWTQSLAGGAGRQLTQNQRETVAESGLDWMPDGRLVCATFSGSDNRPHVWIMDADGTHARQLTTMLSAWPAASPDGKWIYFNGGTSTSVIWKLPVEGGEPVQVTTGPTDYRPILSADGAWLYFTQLQNTRNRAMRLSLAGGAATPLTEPAVLFEATQLWPGDRRLFGYARNLAARRQQAATVPVDGGPVEFLEGVPASGGPLPDGSGWLFDDIRNGANALYVKPLAGRGPERLLVDLGQDRVIRWAVSRDTRTLAYVRGRTTRDVVLIKAR